VLVRAVDVAWGVGPSIREIPDSGRTDGSPSGSLARGGLDIERLRGCVVGCYYYRGATCEPI